MEVFNLRNTLIGDYATYIKSFFTIQDERIDVKVQEEMRQGVPWPDPLISDFRSSKGNRNQRLKRVMALARPKNSAELGEQVAALGDEDNNIRWLAGSSLVRLWGTAVVQAHGGFVTQRNGSWEFTRPNQTALIESAAGCQKFSACF